MSNQESSPNNPSSAPEQIPHSGVHGYEKPVTEFDKTSLRDAHEQGLITTPETPAALHPAQEKEKKKLSTAAKMSIGGLVFGLLPAVGAGAWTMKKMNDVEDAFLGSSDTPSVSAPAVPGQEAPDNDTPEYRFTSEPVVLTDGEVATLEAGDSEESRAIYDAKLIPKIQEAVDQIHENTSKGIPSLDGLDLTNFAPSNKAVVALVDVEHGSEAGVQVCHTTPNEDGSLNFCGPTSFTRVEIGKPIEFYYNDYATNKDYRLKTDVRAEINSDNSLILTAND